MKNVTVIGLGTMGASLARVLIEKGYRVTVWNRSPGKAEPLQRQGARVAASSAEAIAANSTVLVCVKSHIDTRAVLESADSLENKNIIELSTGSAPEARALYQWLEAEKAIALIGMICTFPANIGEQDSTILTVGSAKLWEEASGMLRDLAGKSGYIGDRVGSLAIIYSALFLPRQGFMFGMIYGALLCHKAGVSMETYVEQLPLTIKVVHDYYDVFAASVPAENFDDPPASIDTYAAAFRDTLESFRENDVNDELPALLSKFVNLGVDAGLGDKQITALVKLLGR